jgi:glycosyltransferase involved in cell wall biosynthesis
MKISVIIPAFNAEKWINDCINSVLRQSHTDFELIIVVDGGSDGTLEVAKAAETFDHRVKCIYQENQGLGGARRTGVKHATGVFLLFLDSDDILLDDALEKFAYYQMRHNADLVISDFRPFNDGNECVYGSSLELSPYYVTLCEKYKKICDWVDFKDDFDFAYPGIYLSVACLKLFKRSLWDLYVRTDYDPLRHAEDFYDTKSYAISTNKIFIAPFVSMHYRVRASGQAKSRSRKALEVLRAFDISWSVLRSLDGGYHGYKQDIDRFFIYMLLGQLFKNIRYRDMVFYIKRFKACIEKMPDLIPNDRDAELIRMGSKSTILIFLISILRYWKLRYK